MRATYFPAYGVWLARISMDGNVLCIFKVAPTDEQGHAMAAALRQKKPVPEYVPGTVLPNATEHCPVCAQTKEVVLHYESMAGIIRVVRNGYLHARCPDCKSEFDVRAKGSPAPQ